MKKIICLIALPVFLCLTCKDDGGTGPVLTELPKLNISSVTLFEGEENHVFSFLVNSSKDSDQEIKVDYTTMDVTAGAGDDYIAKSGVLSIPAGQRSATIDIEVIGDIYKETDEEFKVILSNPINATISSDEGLGTIRNEDTFVFVPEDGYITPESYTGYNLVWADEFSGNTLNTSDWTYEMGGHGWGNQELQYYTDRSENVYLEDGGLVIEAKEEDFSGSSYTSARLITKDKQTFTYGRVDIRAILPEGQGIWPALWMLGNNISTIGWPACGEIDIMELLGHEPNVTHGTAHWGPQGQGWSHHQGESYTLSGETFADKYHVFSIIWEPNSIKWLLNDNEFYNITNAQVNGNYPFNEEFFFIFNIAVGGTWPGSPDASTQFPQRMKVDYVRVFQEN